MRTGSATSQCVASIPIIVIFITGPVTDELSRRRLETKPKKLIAPMAQCPVLTDFVEKLDGFADHPPVWVFWAK
ncbi:hypothetical protein CPY51_32055 [Rhizobium tubonense]|uniref:Uncharacterized protein n=1 Tax=Rhizobium tubonense TaxID=484088 RepID=A0A2W4C741_9HYPH|nr:hypothetical protein CPY51_32055 [Rhizobium tubonense]